VSIVLFVAFYLFQLFSTSPTSVPKRVVLTLRYMVPLLPLMALACAESAPRWWRKWSESRATSPAVLNARASGVLLAAILAIGTAGTLVNPLFHWWSSTQASIRDSIEEHVPLDAVLITNYPATRKFIHVLDRKFVHVSTTRYDGTIQTRTIRELAARWPEVFLVLLDKTDSEHWKGDAVRNAEIVASLEPGGMRPELLLDRNASPTDRLRIWRVQLAGSESAGGSGSPPAAAR
jgi:hypothetical protein